jgi:hypothetical protein
MIDVFFAGDWNMGLRWAEEELTHQPELQRKHYG